nr:ribonuclease H-like domain-containing protein [Tanacetum cinerariifolium]GEX91366.1 ribonuclease H-like domain-containing protein [Tanacetum cinerariifolium]
MYKGRFVANGRTQQVGIDCDDTFSPVVKRLPYGPFSALLCLVDSLFINLMLRTPFSWRSFKDDLYVSALGFYGFSLFAPCLSLTLFFIWSEVGPSCNGLLVMIYALVSLLVDVSLPCLFITRRKYASRTPVDTRSKLGFDGDLVLDLTLYQKLAGGLQYLTFTRRNISYGVQQIYLYMHDPREPHFAALKRILRRGALLLDGLLQSANPVQYQWMKHIEIDIFVLSVTWLLRVRGNLKVAQVNLDNNPHSHEFKERKVITLKEYNEAVKDEERVFGTKLNNEESADMVREVTNFEIKNAMFDIGDNKASGPDGYTSTFYKNALKIMGKDVCLAIKEFFNIGYCVVK